MVVRFFSQDEDNPDGGRGKRYLALLVVAVAVAAGLIFRSVHASHELTIGERIAPLGPIAEVEVFAFPTVALPAVQVGSPNIFSDGCSFKTKDASRIQALLDIFSKAKIAPRTSLMTSGGNWGSIVRSASGQSLVVRASKEGEQYLIDLIHDRTVETMYTSNGSLEHEIYKWAALSTAPLGNEPSLDGPCLYQARRAQQ